jgi:hypothetical protein
MQKERDHWEDHDAVELITLRWILAIENGVVLTLLVWFRTGTSGELL